MSQADTEDIADVVVVGGGAAGLSAAGALSHLGIRPVVLDGHDRIGATWERRYDRLHLHTVRQWSGLAHLDMPRDFPRYVSKDQFANYLRSYAETLKIDVRLAHRVQAVEFSENKHWHVASDRGAWRARAVILATGRHRDPVVPAWPGRDTFRGQVLHSDEYKSGATYSGQRVLVVGIGNSGAEIAADLAEDKAAHVAVAVRSRPPIMLRDLFGVLPAQFLGIALASFSAGLVDVVGARVRRIGTGDLTAYGLGAEAWGPFTARRPPVIDVGFLRELKARRVHVRPDVERLTEHGVRFRDGREEAFDAIVAATGYRTALDRILDVPEAIGPDGRPRFASGERTPWPGLYFIGYDDTTRGALFEANRLSRRLAPEVVAYLRQR
jgi:cation diffusion facilitator CzcD-associated flavoprotein CzcO